jgi:choline-glycine betaine transporter
MAIDTAANQGETTQPSPKADKPKTLRHIAFWPPAVLFVAAAIWNFADQKGFSDGINAANTWIIANLAWAFSLGVLAALGVVIYAMCSKFGDVRIGGRNAKPMLDSVRFFSITLTTIIAVGILFWGTSEPLYHLLYPPESLHLTAGSPEAQVFAVSTMYIHWGFLPLAIYALPTVLFAFAFYNMRKPYTIASTLVPIFGDRILGKWSQALDALVMYSLVAGMAASLGTGILSVSGGLAFLTGWQSGLFSWLVVDIAIVVAFVISSITGLFNGIKWLSQANMILFIFLFVFVLVFGGSAFLLNLSTEAFANSLANFFPKAAFTGAAAGDSWAGGWTIFYWCNWLSWAPISGMFLGRIAYGHTVRKALTVQFLLPAIFDILWVGVFASAALKIERDNPGALSDALKKGTEYVQYAFFDHFPAAMLLIPIFVIAVFLSYVTGSDAYTTTLGGLSSTGISAESPEPARWQKIFWGVLLGVVAWILLAATNGTDGIKMLSNLGGVPALFLTAFMIVSLVKVARNPSRYDVRKQDYDEDGRPIPSKAQKATYTEEVVFDEEPELVEDPSL